MPTHTNTRHTATKHSAPATRQASLMPVQTWDGHAFALADAAAGAAAGGADLTSCLAGPLAGMRHGEHDRVWLTN
jgi:hypothetical protein